MSLLTDLYSDIRSNVSWEKSSDSVTASFENSEITFTAESDCWSVHPVGLNSEKVLSDTVTTVLKTFITQYSPSTLRLESTDAYVRTIFDYAFDVVSNMYNYGLGVYEDAVVISTEIEILEEEPNSSLQYHRMFPNKRLNAELESYGYKFRDGGGMKLMRKHMGSSNRNSGPHERRTMQSIVIFKDGRIFRKISKQKWNQLVDPSDKDSESWGIAFQRKMVAAERKERQSKGIDIHFK